MRKYFGTDGVRGRVGVAPMTAGWVLKLGKAVATHIISHGGSRALIGCDTRISCDMLQAALGAGLSSVGIQVYNLGIMTSPAVAHLTKIMQADAGLMISASHNPYHDNGIKCFAASGEKLCEAKELAIEKLLEDPIACLKKPGKIVNAENATEKYVAYCQRLLPKNFSLNGLKVVVDCANGAGYILAPQILQLLGVEVIAIHNNPNGTNINDKCGSTHTDNLVDRVKTEKADLGIALDGDGDRVVLVSSSGRVMDGDDILYILATWYKKSGKLNGGVVGTVMSNLGLEQALLEQDIEFHRSNVGDRYVLQDLRKRNWNIGGEASGHIICLDSNNTGDGIVVALKVLQALQDLNTNLDEMSSNVNKYTQIIHNVAVMDAKQASTKVTVQEALVQAEIKLQGKGRVLLRPSGTEPVVRIMVEGSATDLLQDVANELAAAVCS